MVNLILPGSLLFLAGSGLVALAPPVVLPDSLVSLVPDSSLVPASLLVDSLSGICAPALRPKGMVVAQSLKT